MLNAIDESKFNEIFGKPTPRTKEETAAHYVGEVKKMHQAQYDALIARHDTRPELPLDALVRLVAWELNQEISNEAQQQFFDVVAAFKKAEVGA